MLKFLIVRACEAIILAGIVIGAVYGAAAVAPPGALMVQGGCAVKEKEIVSWQIVIQKQIVLPPAPKSKNSVRLDEERDI